VIHDEETDRRWLGRVEEERHVSIDLREEEIRNAIARGQYLGTTLEDREKEMYLGHDFTIRVLGELTKGATLSFRSVVRNLPPRGAKVKQLEQKELSSLVMLDKDGPVIGHYAVGDEVFDESHGNIAIKFDVRRFISRRTAVFGVAGFGKTNLIKNIVAFLSVGAPEVGKLVFDLEGEYAFKTEKSRGLADISVVNENLLVFTNSDRSDYQDVIAGPSNLNLEDIPPYKAISLLLPESRQERVYAGILSSLSREKWQEVVQYIAENGWGANPANLADILGVHLEGNQASIDGMIRNLVPMLRGHTAESTLLTEIYDALRVGATVVVDLSQTSLDSAFKTMLVLIDEIFEKNQDAYVSGQKVPEIIVFVEESQNFLSDKQVREGNPVARLAKEGRKYNLGLVYVTQQPGAIADEILSQTDNFFVLHLLAKSDLKALINANPHYDGVIADFIQNESLQGHAYIYSRVPGMPLQSYVFGIKAIKFEDSSKELEKLKPTGYRAFQQRRLEVLQQMAKKLAEVLTFAVPDDEGEQYVKYRWGVISGELRKRLPDDWQIYDLKRPEFVDDRWLSRAFEQLNIQYDKRWENGKPYIYIEKSRLREVSQE
jgi:hypothetical protein